MEEYIYQFMLIFARLGTAICYLPGTSTKYFFMRGKLIMALLITLSIMPIISPLLPQLPSSTAILVSYIFIEMLVGFLISLAAYFYFQSLQFVGQIISMQSGLGAAIFFDPMQKSQIALFSNFLMLSCIVFIFAADMHHLYIEAVVSSYERMPAGLMLDSGDLSNYAANSLNNSFVLAFKVVSPFLVISLAVHTGNGILSRLMPNFQVFFVMTPAQMLILFMTIYVVYGYAISKVASNIADSLSL